MLTKKISGVEKDWFERYKHLSKDETHHVLLESGRGGRFNIIGLEPVAVLQGKDKFLTIQTKEEQIEQQGDLLELTKEWLSHYVVPFKEGLPDFQGGAVGYISYDLVRSIETLPELAEDDLAMPDLYFLVFEDVFVYDHEEGALWIIINYFSEQEEEARLKLSYYEKAWSSSFVEKNQWQLEAYKTTSSSRAVSMNEAEFQQAVHQVQEYISQGDVFQINLSVRQSEPLKTEPLHIYERLRTLNPSPYMSYFHVPEFQLVSGSPELLVKKKGYEVSTRPIAGTRSRGKTDREDQELAESLITNEKERAEHVMLVDLERNDLGRVCEYGTVEVNEFMVIEKYSHVMHIVSNVRGKMKESHDAFDLIRASFPGGTITGAPKVRTMEIIEELEPVRRGIYTGSIGWIGFNGDMELNITIRTLVAKDGQAHVQAGAGIVIDSNPKWEYEESLKKARALWRAKELSEEELAVSLQNK
ncbi:aminodeoxychorismate synthase, component I [Bacillus taeanensis]|uniref:Aminodeoxychorismate synthase component 1 n=1 Tax=Bacillus taeanensis TaxID=273032 RepID=A0A366XNH4_9BACI|nr:aminodeoxychorismate synthase, component I [Bacillus taeanensis]RBW67672.1 aminodeoxychorismate synthase, component I [Bacillus taeanensis]